MSSAKWRPSCLALNELTEHPPLDNTLHAIFYNQCLQIWPIYLDNKTSWSIQQPQYHKIWSTIFESIKIDLKSLMATEMFNSLRQSDA